MLARRSVTLEPTLDSARAARRLLTATLESADRQHWGDAGSLALSEIVTNAVLHAHTQIVLVIEVHAARLLVEVEDGNPSLPVRRDYDTSATTGRGMSLVAAVSDECGVHSLGGRGKVVWFTVTDAADAADTADTVDAEAAPEAPGDDIDALLAAWDVDGDCAGETAPAADTVEVALDRMPLQLWLAARQHHDAILRELVLRESGAEAEDGLHAAAHDVDHALADAARGLVIAAVLAATQEDPERPAADVVLAVPRGHGEAFTALKHALDTGERLASTGHMLTRAGLPEIVAVRDWVCAQVHQQLAGVAPSPWPGAAQRHFETVAERGPSDGWDDEGVRRANDNVVAADDTNRIVAVSEPLATLLGWEVDHLVGRRIVTLIPERLREAHVAGFTRHLLTGETKVLGTELVLPVRRADGSEIDCRVLIEHAPVGRGRTVFVARMHPADEPPTN